MDLSENSFVSLTLPMTRSSLKRYREVQHQLNSSSNPLELRKKRELPNEYINNGFANSSEICLTREVSKTEYRPQKALKRTEKDTDMQQELLLECKIETRQKSNLSSSLHNFYPDSFDEMQKSTDDKKIKSECLTTNELSTSAYDHEEFNSIDRDELLDKGSKIVDDVSEETNFNPLKFLMKNLTADSINWTFIQRQDLNLKYAKLLENPVSDAVLKQLEKHIEYFNGELTKVKVFGKWHNIPRKQVAFGDKGLSYTFSGNSLPAKPWDACPLVKELRDYVELATGECFNFVLINRYKNGNDHMGEHRDNEKELNPNSPIASLSFGEERPFVFKHRDSRGRNSKREIAPLQIKLESGSLLLMEQPTNEFWYHSLPVRKNIKGVRINLTFRQMIHVKKH